ncbi:MAG TPA: bifunctional nuclease family protein [Chloroflexota bacterium]|jgi:bifunctional DNase/RNase|nr:bifunctional nuclease family protein [Chloroflexota bacterium]
MPVEMVVESIRVSLYAAPRIVVLKEINRERYLPIVIGLPEAEAIAIKMQNHEVPRPLTHDLLCTMIKTLGGRVTHVTVTDLIGETFFARIVMDVEGRHVEVDSRPSDAIALALRLEVPIFAEESVLERGAIEPEERPRNVEREKKADRIREEQLAAFRDVINQLNLDDFGK